MPLSFLTFFEEIFRKVNRANMDSFNLESSADCLYPSILITFSLLVCYSISWHETLFDLDSLEQLFTQNEVLFRRKFPFLSFDLNTVSVNDKDVKRWRQLSSSKNFYEAGWRMSKIFNFIFFKKLYLKDLRRFKICIPWLNLEKDRWKLNG